MSAPNDLLNFVPADIFFPTVSNFDQAQEAVSVESSTSTKRSDPLRYAAHVTLRGTGQKVETHCLVQFVTPQIWRIRYNPKFNSLADFPDENSSVHYQGSHKTSESNTNWARSGEPLSGTAFRSWSTTFKKNTEIPRPRTRIPPPRTGGGRRRLRSVLLTTGSSP